jgi:hypothetical protein
MSSPFTYYYTQFSGIGQQRSGIDKKRVETDDDEAVKKS